MFDATLDTVTFDGDGRPPTRHSAVRPYTATSRFDTTDAQIVRPYVDILDSPRGDKTFPTWA